MEIVYILLGTVITVTVFFITKLCTNKWKELKEMLDINMLDRIEEKKEREEKQKEFERQLNEIINY